MSARTTAGSASPPRKGQALAGGFGLRGRCVRARTLPLPIKATPRFPCRPAERKGPVFRWKSGPAHVGPAPRDRFNFSQQRAAPAPGRGRRCPVALGHRAVWVESFRGGRVNGPCRPRPHEPRFDAGPGANVSPATVPADMTDGGPCRWRCRTAGRCVRARTLPLPDGTFPPLAGPRRCGRFPKTPG